MAATNQTKENNGKIQKEIMNVMMEKQLIEQNAPQPTTTRKDPSTSAPCTTMITHVECTEEQKETDYVKVGDMIDDRFKILGKIREGGYGQIYKAFDSKTETEVAMKMEASEENHPNVEAYVLAKFHKNLHCPKLFAYGKLPNCQFVAMQLLGKSLSELRRQCQLSPQRLSASTTIRMVRQCLEAIEGLHGLGIIHRDVKPSNFAIGIHEKNKNKVYMLDYGLARFYLTKEGKHRPYRENVGFRGTVRYASLNTHDLKEQSRRDDLWSLFYAYYELMSGQLPWRKMNECDEVADMKRKKTPEKLSKKMPPGTTDFVLLIRALSFEDTPEYKEMADLLLNTLHNLDVKVTDPFDWQVADCKELVHWVVKKEK